MVLALQCAFYPTCNAEQLKGFQQRCDGSELFVQNHPLEEINVCRKRLEDGMGRAHSGIPQWLRLPVGSRSQPLKAPGTPFSAPHQLELKRSRWQGTWGPSCSQPPLFPAEGTRSHVTMGCQSGFSQAARLLALGHPQGELHGCAPGLRTARRTQRSRGMASHECSPRP